ncbi:MAG: hypothetical protein K2H81_00435, partial [Alistipes sp.]|nr:hypothetical protein [Alistipes sp.]
MIHFITRNILNPDKDNASGGYLQLAAGAERPPPRTAAPAPDKTAQHNPAPPKHSGGAGPISKSARPGYS